MAVYKINSNKLVAFLYTKDKQSEKEIRETTPSTIVINTWKYIGVNLSKQVKGLYDKNFNSLKNGIEDLRRWKDLSCSWIGIINSENSHLAKKIYRFNWIFVRIPTQLFTELDRAICKFIYNHKKPWIAKNYSQPWKNHW